VISKLQYPDLQGKHINHIMKDESWFCDIKKNFNKDRTTIIAESLVYTINEQILPVNFICSRIENPAIEYWLIGKTRSTSEINEVSLSDLITKNTIDTQEKERRRFSKDLHDSLGQQLTAIKFNLTTLKNLNSLDSKQTREILSKSDETLNSALIELRNICFNLNPKILQDSNLKAALTELCRKTGLSNQLRFDLKINVDLPILNKDKEVSIFRIIQEFIANSIKHGNAKKITIHLNNKKDEKIIVVLLKDDGRGFNVKEIGASCGTGIKNIALRVQSYNGKMEMNSTPSRGAKLKIIIPY
jgi:signal transduction histidine kinase